MLPKKKDSIFLGGCCCIRNDDPEISEGRYDRDRKVVHYQSLEEEISKSKEKAK